MLGLELEEALAEPCEGCARAARGKLPCAHRRSASSSSSEHHRYPEGVSAGPSADSAAAAPAHSMALRAAALPIRIARKRSRDRVRHGLAPKARLPVSTS